MTRRIKWAVLLLLFCLPVAADEIDWYVDPAAVGAGDGTSWADAYTTLFAWEAAEEDDLTVAEDNYVVHCRTSGANPVDGTNLDIAGWTTSADYDIVIQVDQGDRHDGTWDATSYRLELANADGSVISINENYVTFIGLQFYNTVADDGIVIYINLQDAGNSINFHNCIVRMAATVDADTDGIRCDDSDAIVTVRNTLIYDIGIPDADAWEGTSIRGAAACTWFIQNCTVVGGWRGISVSGTPTLVNTAVKDCTVCFDIAGVVDTTYCASEDATADDDGGAGNQVNVVAWDFDNEGADDYHIGTDSALYDTGFDMSGTYTLDIDGETRGTWDIGADEVTPVVGVIGQFIIINQ